MKRQNRGNLTIFIFPYLFLNDKEWKIKNYHLKSSYKEIFDKESNRIRGHLTKIARSFRLPNTSNINQYTYGWTTIHNKDEWLALKEFLDKLSTILRYEELSDERKGANFSNFDYAVFEIYRPMSTRKFAYYEGVLNGRNRISFYYPETKFCPNFPLRPYIYRIDSKSQVLSHLLYLQQTLHSKEEEKRLVRAFDWFSKSYKSDPEIDDLEKFINIAIAFEALFNSPEDSIRIALTTGIISLLGETREMIDWIKDFYDQRSAIAHGREEPTVLYKDKQSTTPHIDHLIFARKVFTRCIKAIFTSREKVYTQDLHKELVSNERRIREILTELKSKKTLFDLHKLGVFDRLDSLNTKDTTGKSLDVVEIGKKLLPLVRSHLKSKNRTDLIDQLDAIITYSGTDLSELGLKYGHFHSEFGSVYFEDKTISLKELYKLALKGAIYNFTNYAGWKLMHDAFNRRS